MISWRYAGQVLAPAWVSLVMAALCFAGIAHGQQLHFERIGVAQGLPDNTIYDMLQDRRGFLWLASEGGLVRYDGYSFATFLFDPSDPNTLSTNVLTSLVEDRKGLLWVGTNRGGINRFDPVTGRVDRFALPAPTSRIVALAEDSAGGMWASAIQSDGATFYHLHPDSIHFQNVSLRNLALVGTGAVLLSKLGAVWTMQGPDGLNRIDLGSGNVRTYTIQPYSTGTESAPRMMEDQDGAVWIRTGDVLQRIQPEDGSISRFVVPGFGRFMTAANVVVRDGSMWIPGNRRLHVVDLESGRFSTYQSEPNDPNSLASGTIATMFMDRSGIIWIGTVYSGLSRIVPRRQQFHHYYHVPDRPSGLAHNKVHGFMEDAEGSLYVSTAAGGVQRFDSSGAFVSISRNWTAHTGGEMPIITSLLEDSQGSRWFGSWGHGLFRLEARTGRLRHYTFPGGLDGNAMRVLFEDDQETIWVGTETGLRRYDRLRDIFEPFSGSDRGSRALGSATVWSMAQDREGNLWVGTFGGGLFRMDVESGTVHRLMHDPDQSTSLSSNNVSALLEDRQGRFWVGTYGGSLNRWDAEASTFIRYTAPDSFMDAYVHGIVEDDAGDLWISTNRGLARLVHATATFRTYHVEDGLQSARFGPGVFLRRRDGSLLFGGANGFNWFDPADIVESTYHPAVAVTAFSVLGRPVALDSLLRHTAELRIPWARNEFEFELAALDFAAPEKNRYAHRLDGYDSEWRQLGTRRYGGYANLKSGRYLLRVKGANGDGLWSEEQAIAIVVVPPFWMTSWFRLLAATAVIALVVGVARYTATRRLQRRLYQLEVERRLHDERGRISRDLHDHVGAQLTYVIASLDLNTRQLADLGIRTQQHQLQALRSHAQTTMRQLRETIWTLRQEVVTVGGLADRLESHAAQQTRDLGIPRLHVAHTGNREIELSPSRALNIFRIAQEAVTNVLKHAGAENLYVSTRVLGTSGLVVEIEDDGVGMRRNQTASCESSGYGLANMRSRTKELGGELVLEDRPEGGVRVRLSVPLS